MCGIIKLDINIKITKTSRIHIKTISQILEICAKILRADLIWYSFIQTCKLFI